MLVRIGLRTINEEADACKLVLSKSVNEQDLLRGYRCFWFVTRRTVEGPRKCKRVVEV